MRTSAQPPTSIVTQPDPWAPQPAIYLSLLGSFELRPVRDLPPARGLTRETQHLLAFLAFKHRRVSRTLIAGTLWPAVSDKHALASLRTALARLGELPHQAVLITATELELAPNVVVDLHDGRRIAYGILDTPADEPLPFVVGTDVLELLSAECLPDWYDEWVLIESEEWRQVRFHAMGALALRLAVDGDFGKATAAALATIRIDSLRESAWATLIRVHLAEGDQSEAVRAFGTYRAILMDELGVEPTRSLRALLPDGLLPRESGRIAQG